jgi:hypothetical protein
MKAAREPLLRTSRRPESTSLIRAIQRLRG